MMSFECGASSLRAAEARYAKPNSCKEAIWSIDCCLLEKTDGRDAMPPATR